MEKDRPRKLERETLKQLSPEQLVDIIIEQAIAIEKLNKKIVQLEQQVQQLRVSRDLDSKISSKPPSSDLLKKSEKKNKSDKPETEKNKRKPGGQPGHTGKTRKGFGRIDRYEVLKAQTCSSCGQQLLATAKSIKIEKQSVAVLVEKPIEVVEYQRHYSLCDCCGEITSPPSSRQIIPGQDLGIKLQALLVWLGNYGHLPYEKQQELLWELGRIDLGVGTLVATNQRGAVAVEQSVQDLEQWIIQKHPPLHIDETPWLVKGIKEWLWVFTNPNFCLFRGGDTRSRLEIQAQLGVEYPGVIISDDFNVYNGYQVAAQQKCLAHLRRHFKRLTKIPGKYNKSIGLDLTDLIDEAFVEHRKFRITGNQKDYCYWANKFKPKIKLIIERWFQKAGYEAKKLLRNLKLKADQWWYFLAHPEIPPDNNLAERSLRLAVTKRKVSGGSRSMERFKDTANNLSVIQTCRFQGRSVMDFFASALRANVGMEKQPSLIPDSYT